MPPRSRDAASSSSSSAAAAAPVQAKTCNGLLLMEVLGHQKAQRLKAVLAKDGRFDNMTAYYAAYPRCYGIRSSPPPPPSSSSGSAPTTKAGHRSKPRVVSQTHPHLNRVDFVYACAGSATYRTKQRIGSEVVPRCGGLEIIVPNAMLSTSTKRGYPHLVSARSRANAS